MKRRVSRAIGALALLGIWTFTPLGGMLRHPEALVRLLTALGLLLGTAADWLVRYALHLRMTRRALTGAGWVASGLLLIGIFRDAIAGPAAPAHLASIVAYTGALAWGVRLLLGLAKREASARRRRRGLLVRIRGVRRPDEIAPAG